MQMLFLSTIYLSLNCGNPYSPDTDMQTNAPFRLDIYKMTQVAGLKKDIAQICSEQPESQVSAHTALCLKCNKWLMEEKKQQQQQTY